MRPAALPLHSFPAWWEKSRPQAGACCCGEVWNWLCPWQGDGEKHGVLWLLWTLALLINTFPLAYSQSVDPCKEAEPKSILLKPIKSLIQWTIEHQLLSLSSSVLLHAHSHPFWRTTHVFLAGAGEVVKELKAAQAETSYLCAHRIISQACCANSCH